MARKKKKQLSQADQLTIAQRELEKGNSRQALKYAKACYRKNPSETERIILQRALLSRGRELHARSMFDPARAIIVELDDLGEVAAEYQADVVRLRALLCVDDSGSDAELLKNDRQLRDELADHAVLHGPNASGRREFRETAEAIRGALAALENDQTDRATELITPIGRDSSFADWKLLIRGLTAYYQGDEQRMVANWSRLANDRPARRIAETLSVIAGTEQPGNVGLIRARVDRLVRAVETPLVVGLRALQKKMRDEDFAGPVLRAELRKFMNTYAKSEPIIAQRVAQLFINLMIKEEDVRGLMALKQVLPTLPLDPNLNRAAALVSESDRDLDGIDTSWNAYINDLQTCEALTAAQRATAVALVYQRIATHLVMAAHQADNLPNFLREGDDDDEYSERLLQEAEGFLRQSLEADPDLRDSYLDLGVLLRMREKTKDAAATFKELGRRFPDDFEAMTAIARHFISENEPGVAKTYALKARALRPRDSTALNLLWHSCIATAREAAKMRQFGLAEAELDEAETLVGSDKRHAYLLAAVRAAVAFKGNRCESGEAYVQQTLAHFEKPTAGLLIVHSQTLRCGVTNREIRDDLKRRLDKSLKGRKNGQAAGVMAEYMHALDQAGVEYPGKGAHVKQVTKYLNECGRVKWQPEHLVNACRFAGTDQDYQALLEKLAKRGRSLFGKNPYFCYFAGQAEMMRGPYDLDQFVATSYFRRAIALSKSGDVSLADADLQTTSRALSVLERGHFGPSPQFGPFDTWDHDCDEPEDDFDLDEMSFEELLGTMPPELKRELEKAGLDPKAAVGRLIEMLGRKMN